MFLIILLNTLDLDYYKRNSFSCGDSYITLNQRNYLKKG
jgi:hypothetical protein